MNIEQARFNMIEQQIRPWDVLDPAVLEELRSILGTEVDRLIEQFDPESNFRRLAGLSAGIVTMLAVALSAWHYYTAGFGLLRETTHRGIHMAFVIGMIFLVFPFLKAHETPASSPLKPSIVILSTTRSIKPRLWRISSTD